MEKVNTRHLNKKLLEVDEDTLLLQLHALDNEIRWNIVKILYNNPEGLFFDDLYDLTGLKGKGSLVYHLKILKKANLVRNEYIEKRKGKKFSRCKLTDGCKKLLHTLLQGLLQA